MARREKAEDEGPGVPVWIVSFSDMVTLLLAFFVLLQSFAKVQDPEMFFVGQGSFKQAIAGMGLPAWLFGRQEKPSREYVNPKHSMDEGEPEKPEPKNRDADAEKIRKMFVDLKNDLATSATDLKQKAIRVEATPIHFAPGSARLDEAGKAYLRQFAFDIRQTLASRSLRYYVIGLAADERDPARQWAISAMRARAVERALAGLLDDGTPPGAAGLYSWGAGAGGQWCRRRGFVPEKTHVAIAVVEESTQDG